MPAKNTTITNTPVKNIISDTSITLIAKKFNNPVLIYGSSFGNYYQSLYKLAMWDDMYLFTAKTLKIKYGKQQLIKKFNNLQFAYTLNLKSSIKLNDTTFVLNYISNKIATKTITRINVVIENDTTKFLSSNF